MKEHKGRFGDIFLEGVLECVLEVDEIFLYVVVPLMLVSAVCFLVFVVYHCMVDPNALELASRSDLLSIDPDKWLPRP